MFKASAIAVLTLAGILLAKPTTPPGLDKMDAPQVAGKEKNQKMDLNQVDVNAWMDLSRLVGITTGTPILVDDIKIDRDFKEYLVQTVDRESTERKNQEN
jgi:hypothetical protein